MLRTALFLAAAAPAVGQASHAPPDDPGFRYRGYVNATVDAVRARFDRLPVAATGALESPGVRVDFVTDATAIDLRVEYLATSFQPGSGLFRLEVDGVLQPGTVGSDVDVGVVSYPLYQQASAVPHAFSLVYPFASDVDFLGLELQGGSAALLGPPGPPPALTWAAYGDSITHGYDASSVTAGYPHQVARMRGWTAVNLGFFGQVVDPADGTTIGALGADVVTLAIGVNDWFPQTGTPPAAFSASYAALLDNVRALQPTVPLYALTPVWTDFEGLTNPVGATVEDYRQLIRDVVLPRTTADPELYLVEGSTLVPPGLAWFPDGVHPNDAGFAFYASALGDDNRVAEPGFETGGFAWTDLGNSAVVGAPVASGAAALRVGPGAGGREQPVGRVRRGRDYVLTAASRLGAPGEVASFGVSFHDPLGAELDRVEVAVTWTAWTTQSVTVPAPASFAQARVFCSKAAGASFLHVDDVELTEVGPLAPTVRCTAKVNSQGCVPWISTAGSPSVTSPVPFDVLATDVLNQRNGLLFYGYGPAAISPFNGGTLCVRPPLRRLPLQNAGGTPPPTSDCSGTYAFDFNAHVQGGADPLLVAGQRVDAQWWSRDAQHPDGSGAGLTDAVELLVGP